MTAHALIFYFLSTITILSSIMVISTKNTVHAVFFLILDFVSISALFIMIGAEFVGMILLIVYVGAVAVLFLFVVMMLEGNFIKIKQSFLQYLPFGFFIGVVILLELVLIIGSWQYRPEFIKTAKISYNANETNTEQIGKLIYTDFFLPFQLSGIVLLVAMIGAILLTFRRRDNVKRQDILKQSSREREDSIVLVDVESNIGVFGIFVNRKNVIVILMSIELILLSVNVNLVAFSVYLQNITGQIFALFILTVAAAEAAIGLAILVVFFRNRGSIQVEDINSMKG
jgi:NADH-quinone oxidoreductase subunit J